MLNFLIASLAGFITLKKLSDPKLTIQKTIPCLKLKWIELTPNVRIHVKGKVIHIHHWMQLSVIFIVTIFVDNGIFSLSLARGFIFGGMIQGFTFPDWKKIIFDATHKK